MKHKDLQLAKEYEEQIRRLRGEIASMDRNTFFELRTPNAYEKGVARDLNEFPRLKAAIVAAFEEELNEYEEKLKRL